MIGRNRTHLMGHLKAFMITDVNQGLRAVSAKPLVRVAEARGFEPRMGANPNRISSPVTAPKATASLWCPPQSAQVSGVVPGKATQAAAVLRNPSRPSSGPARASYSPGRRMRARTHPAALGHPSARPQDNPEMTMPHGGPQDLAGLADDRPLTCNDAGTVY